MRIELKYLPKGHNIVRCERGRCLSTTSALSGNFYKFILGVHTDQYKCVDCSWRHKKWRHIGIPWRSIELIGNHLILMRKHYLTVLTLLFLYLKSQCKRPKHLNGYLFKVGNVPLLIKSYVHLHYSSEYQISWRTIKSQQQKMPLLASSNTSTGVWECRHGDQSKAKYFLRRVWLDGVALVRDDWWSALTAVFEYVVSVTVGELCAMQVDRRV